MAAIIEWIKWAVESIAEIIKGAFLWFLDILWGFLQTLLHFIFDQVLSLIEFVIGLIDFKNDLFDLSLGWTALPDQLIYILNACGFDNGLLIIAGALLIRLTLNLIPGVATRV